MWILPKQLISAFALDTEALTSDSVELSQTCAQSLMRRSKPSPAKTFLREWKAGNLMRLRSGAISSLSLGSSFLDWWTSSLAVTRASHSAQPESEQEQTTQDTCGHLSQVAFDFFSHDSVSLRMSRDTLALDSEKSLQTWKALVTKRRGEYSQRLKLARLTSGSGSSSWPTAAARDYKGTSPGYLFRADGKCRVDQLPVAVDQAEAGNWPTPTVQEAGKIGNQANHGQLALSNHPALRGEMTREKFEKGKHGPAAPANHSTHGSRLESWATPRCSMAQDKQEDSGRHRLGEQTQHGTTGKLNPRWVEPLMGLPVGWTMPSCLQPIASPASVAMTSSAGNAEDTTQTVHVLGPTAVMTDNRTDELRLLGNGVVPATAALAFRTLLDELQRD